MDKLNLPNDWEEIEGLENDLEEKVNIVIKKINEIVDWINSQEG